MTTRGIDTNDCVKIAEFIDRAIQIGLSLQENSPKLIDFKKNVDNKLSENNNTLLQLKNEIISFTNNFSF